MTNLMRGANFDPANTNPFVVDAYLMFQVSLVHNTYHLKSWIKLTSLCQKLSCFVLIQNTFRI